MRTEKWAREKGLVYTGISSSYPFTELETRLEEIRSKGYKAYICQWTKNPLSRSHTTGATIFTEMRYAKDISEDRLKERLAKLPERRQQRREHYHEELMKDLNNLQSEEENINQQLRDIAQWRNEFKKW